jgi:hypothetical protein
MVAGEAAMIGTSLRLAVQALLRPPLGPLLFVGGVLMAAIRLVLLILVIAVFGTAILLISAVRAISRLGRSGGEA